MAQRGLPESKRYPPESMPVPALAHRSVSTPSFNSYSVSAMSNIAERSLHTRIARSVEAIRRSFEDNLLYVRGKTFDNATAVDHYTALAYTVRDRLLARRVASEAESRGREGRAVAFLSAEYLLGPHLGNNMLNLGIEQNTRTAMRQLGLDLDVILETEEEPGLGNGGLGRLAACFMDSLATLEMPAIGYGIRYEYGIFDQQIKDGWQVEVADAWLRDGNPWELPQQLRYPVKFGGRVERYCDDTGNRVIHWAADSIVQGIAYDTPIPGHGVLRVNLLRLWKSEARETFDFQAFNLGDYYGAVDEMVSAQSLTKVLYPNDEPAAGKLLRFRQQYFFVSCSLQDMIRQVLQETSDIAHFPDRFLVQLNDTHPAIAIAELQRLFVDEHRMPWDTAWELTCRSFAYTNHTLLPEALETWPVELFEHTLPRHLEIIYEINARFLDMLRVRYFDDQARIVRMSLIDEGTTGGGRRVRMAHLACVGSSSINGVAKLHTQLLEQTVLRDFFELWPGRFNNVTNGVTPRRFIALANPSLTKLIDEVVDHDWLRNLDRLQLLEPCADDAAFRSRWQRIKREAKVQLARHIQGVCGTRLQPDAMFDVQVKRIHEYKRQQMNILHAMVLFHRLKQGVGTQCVPRVIVFGGKAAPGYRMAKLIIKLIHSVADVINRDPQVNEWLRIVFIPDFNLKNGQRIYPAADLSEQISTAGKEASGTGNMKFSLNGALTIGTPDGANVEIREAVGEENFFAFGHTVDELVALRRQGYRPRAVYEQNPEFRAVIDLLDSGFFARGDRSLFRPLTDDLLEYDPFFVCADFQDYIECQERVSDAYLDQDRWTRMSILNVARCGYFSSDRSVREYAEKIWSIPQQPQATR